MSALAAAEARVAAVADDPAARMALMAHDFSARPTGRSWYRAHNPSIVGGYLEHSDLAETERARFQRQANGTHVALARVLYAHALVGAPRLALGRLAPLGHIGDPRLGMAGDDEQRLGRLLDYGVIAPRLQRGPSDRTRHSRPLNLTQAAPA